ncbi:hypothetical protein BT93_F2929 [Corymbia citriodora subsp. variegata]|nr:hypothetical protein BT93_F2929 [Corymbia citriodora subsp. variegata]
MSDAPVSRHFEDADEDDLSFCDLPLSSAAVDQPQGFFPSGPAHHPPASSLEDASDFEFSAAPAVSAVDAFLFCGRSVPYDEHECRVDPLLLHSDSFRPREKLRSDSLLRVTRSTSSVAPATACDRSSSSWRRHRALIGITKFPATMELSDIRKRQGRRAPAPLFPVAEGGKEAVAGGRSGGHWSLLRPLRCRSHLVNALAKASLGWAAFRTPNPPWASASALAHVRMDTFGMTFDYLAGRFWAVLF